MSAERRVLLPPVQDPATDNGAFGDHALQFTALNRTKLGASYPNIDFPRVIITLGPDTFTLFEFSDLGGGSWGNALFGMAVTDAVALDGVGAGKNALNPTLHRKVGSPDRYLVFPADFERWFDGDVAEAFGETDGGDDQIAPWVVQDRQIGGDPVQLWVVNPNNLSSVDNSTPKRGLLQKIFGS